MTGVQTCALPISALAVAALAAEGETVIEDCRHVERGYEDLCRDLRALGAQAYWG